MAIQISDTDWPIHVCKQLLFSSSTDMATFPRLTIARVGEAHNKFNQLWFHRDAIRIKSSQLIVAWLFDLKDVYLLKLLVITRDWYT